MGDPGGQVDPWKFHGIVVQPSVVQPVYLELDWRVGATADFNGDGVCDLAWTRTQPGDNGPDDVRLAVTLTDASSQIFPVLSAPGLGESIGPGWVLVGSGDFVGATGSQDPAVTVPDGRADLVLWNATTGKLALWASDGTGVFPPDRRYTMDGLDVPRRPLVVANIDGQGLPEIIWEDQLTGALTYSTLGSDPGTGIALKGEGALTPPSPRTRGWILRAADDFDGDGIDDLLFQHDRTEGTMVWEMSGPTRKNGKFLSPDHLPPDVAPGTNGTWVIVGPR